MKKVIFILITLLFLAACTGSDDELQTFTDDFNAAAEYSEVSKLETDNYGELEIVDGRGWQTLYNSNEYTLDAKYEDGENLSGYYLVIDESSEYESQKGEGYWMGVAIAKTLDLDSSDYMKAFLEALNNGSYNYTENDYMVSFTYPGADGLTSVGMIVNFDKK